MDNNTEVLYFPNFTPEVLPSIKQSLLLYDRVNVIAPEGTPHMASVLSDSSREDVSKISDRGALEEVWDDVALNTQVVGIIKDSEIIRTRRDEFMSALREDLADEEVLAWEKQLKDRRGGTDLSWFVLPSYFDYNPPDIKEPYQIKEFPHDIHNKILRVPFLVGMSLGLSEALWAAIDRGFTLFTDDVMWQQFLMLRLKRGWRHLTQDPELSRALGIEPEVREKFAAATLGTWTLQQRIPKLIKQASDMSFEEIIHLRNESNKKDDLNKFRSVIADLVCSEDLWNATEFSDFKDKAHEIGRKKILPAYKALEEKRVSPGVVLRAFDVTYALQETIKSVPKLFVGAAVPAAVGSAVLWGNVAVAPTALLALGCGLGASFVKNLLDRMGDRRKNRRSAQFLTYPLNLQKAMSDRA
jgi:hypothetical protein